MAAGRFLEDGWEPKVVLFGTITALAGMVTVVSTEKEISMAKTFIVDLSYFLDHESELDTDYSLSLHLVEFLTSIVTMVSYPAPGPPSEYKVRCNRRDADGNQCPGLIEGSLMPETENIFWHCPVCNEKGYITNWQGTLWDLRHAEIEH